MATLKELAMKEDLFTAGHCLCPGCTLPVTLKIALRSTEYPLVVSVSSGCLQVASSHFPATAWRLNCIHTGIGNAAATLSGIRATYTSLKKQGKLPADKVIKFLVIGGDGATYDSGLGAISGAIERGDDFVYLCYDNQSYACSGGQRSSASPMGVSTGTTPVGRMLPGKLQFRKDIVQILAGHKIPYAAQSAPWIWQDLYRKMEKAFHIAGPAFLNVLSPCPGSWKIPTHRSIEISKLAADTCVWPIYEIDHGHQITINYKPAKKLPVREWFKAQQRFIHLLKAENKWIVEKIQEEVDKEWELLLSSEENSRDN